MLKQLSGAIKPEAACQVIKMCPVGPGPAAAAGGGATGVATAAVA